MKLKELFASFYFVYKAEKPSSLQLSVNSKVTERLIFVFANTFELAAKLPDLTVNEAYPML